MTTKGNDSDDPNLANYAQTILRFKRFSIDLRRGLSAEDKSSLATLFTDTFAIITADNPRGKLLSRDLNSGPREALREDLESRGLTLVSLTGESPDGSHSEFSFAVAIPKAEAAALADKFQQTAFFWYDSQGFQLCEGGSGLLIKKL